MFTKKGKYSFFLLLISAIGVFLSGPLILGMSPIPFNRFWDFGSPWTELGATLDILGGCLQFYWISRMYRLRVFSPNTVPEVTRREYKYFSIICLIGIVGDPLGGLLAIAAQLGLYTSLVNVYSSKQ